LQKTTTFLMFDGRAEEAIKLYMTLFADSAVQHIVRYEPGMPGPEGKVMHALFSLAGQLYMAIDSGIEHEFTFTPAMSIYVNCETEEEIGRLFTELSKEGQILMPLDSYPFSARYAWVSDRFGVSWQLSLAG
jgi:predicted 3-demethylubiquinone-9 3-methyltransferase (glyoxalase superfamily)